jgi:hypothetical protein
MTQHGQICRFIGASFLTTFAIAGVSVARLRPLESTRSGGKAQEISAHQIYKTIHRPSSMGIFMVSLEDVRSVAWYWQWLQILIFTGTKRVSKIIQIIKKIERHAEDRGDYCSSRSRVSSHQRRVGLSENKWHWKNPMVKKICLNNHFPAWTCHLWSPISGQSQAFFGGTCTKIPLPRAGMRDSHRKWGDPMGSQKHNRP